MPQAGTFVISSHPERRRSQIRRTAIFLGSRFSMISRRSQSDSADMSGRPWRVARGRQGRRRTRPPARRARDDPGPGSNREASKGYRHSTGPRPNRAIFRTRSRPSTLPAATLTSTKEAASCHRAEAAGTAPAGGSNFAEKGWNNVGPFSAHHPPVSPGLALWPTRDIRPDKALASQMRLAYH